MSDKLLTWEQAVQWLRAQPDQQSLVRACYYDDPLLDAAQRFAASAEWQATLSLLPQTSGDVLDLGAGRGISSYAFAAAGWRVTALEPDPSDLVGAGAIRSLSQASGLSIQVIQEFGEQLPWPDATFDVVYGRQVLHHAHDLRRLCSEIARVLKPAGLFLGTREHVISRRTDLPRFLESHALHKLYGGETAYLLREYRAALLRGGLAIQNEMGPLETPINYFPLSQAEWRQVVTEPLARLLGWGAADQITREDRPLGRWLLPRLAYLRSRFSNSPGRLFTFVARKG